jgi:hypothetical protein
MGRVIVEKRGVASILIRSMVKISLPFQKFAQAIVANASNGYVQFGEMRTKQSFNKR